MNIEYFKIFVTVGVAALGWVVAHHFTSRKSRNDKKTDLSLEYLIRAYRLLTVEIVQRDMKAETWKDLEIIIADIQLFGSAEQIQITKDLIEQIVKGDEFELDLLINSLRTNLRKQLGLSLIAGNIKWLRWRPRQTS